MPFQTDQVRDALAAWQSALEGVRDGLQALVMALGGVDDPALWQFEGLATLVADLAGLPPLAGAEVPEALTFLHGASLGSLATQLARLDEIQGHEQALNAGLGEGWRDLADLTTQLAQAEEWLTGLGVSGDLGLPALAALHGRLEKMLQLALVLAGQLSAVAQRLPPPAAALLQPTPGGFAAFRDLLTLVAQLRVGLLKYRGSGVTIPPSMTCCRSWLPRLASSTRQLRCSPSTLRWHNCPRRSCSRAGARRCNGADCTVGSTGTGAPHAGRCWPLPARARSQASAG